MIIRTTQGGLFNKEITNLTSDKKVYKISNTVFSYGIIDYDNVYIREICDLLDLGTKFFPCFFENKTNFYKNLLQELASANLTD